MSAILEDIILDIRKTINSNEKLRTAVESPLAYSTETMGYFFDFSSLTDVLDIGGKITGLITKMAGAFGGMAMLGGRK